MAEGESMTPTQKNITKKIIKHLKRFGDARVVIFSRHHNSYTVFEEDWNTILDLAAKQLSQQENQP